ncbi:FecR domain-containing protein [Burkholderia gladioli]|uniref:FecR domain-containing protein n=1 Tax=Burkholderia gladioli TaxID=28095 RepID=UPI001642193D|nr:FecR domain-containing protein [Burkholderia gladioli]
MPAADAVSAAADREAPPLDRAVARAAAGWAVRLRESASAEDLAACARWREADPEHERAWQGVLRLDAKFGAMPAAAALPALGRERRVDRRAALKTLGGTAAALAPAGYLAYRLLPWQAWSAEQRTGPGERRGLMLADGTRIELNTGSALNVRFDANERRVELVAGEILVATGADAHSPYAWHRPFVVRTAAGRIRALGTRFVVRDGVEPARAASRVTVLDGAVEITPAAAPALRRRLDAGRQLCFSAEAIGASGPADPHAADWSRGVLFADRMRVGAFAAELARYRPGLLRCDPAVAELRITGAFQIDNTDNILAALPATLPVRVVYRTRYWVTIEPARPEA